VFNGNISNPIDHKVYFFINQVCARVNIHSKLVFLMHRKQGDCLNCGAVNVELVGGCLCAECYDKYIKS